MNAKPTTAQIKTLTTIAGRGGEMNTYAGQPGFYCNSVGPLLRMGLVVAVALCDSCAKGEGCERQLTGQVGGHRCWGRVRITDAGRAAIAPAAEAAPVVEDAPKAAPAAEAGRSARRLANALRAVQVARKLSTSQTVALAKLANRDGIVDAGSVIPVNTAVAMQARGLMSYQFNLAGRAVYLLTAFGYEVAGINRAALVERCHAEALAEADDAAAFVRRPFRS